MTAPTNAQGRTHGKATSVRTDEAVWAAVDLETERQERQLELIASENHASAEVLAAAGTALTNKYAEGYPGRRYYGGCEHVDTVEELARQRLMELFGAERANVQPHSGSAAIVQARCHDRDAASTRELPRSRIRLFTCSTVPKK